METRYSPVHQVIDTARQQILMTTLDVGNKVVLSVEAVALGSLLATWKSALPPHLKSIFVD